MSDATAISVGLADEMPGPALIPSVTADAATPIMDGARRGAGASRAAQESEQRLRNLIAALPAAIYTTDAQGRITFYNQAAVDLAGREPTIGSDEWCVTWRLYWPDGRPMRHDECPMAVALKENRPIRGAEAIAERPDGTRVPFLPYPTPLHDAAGNLIGGVNMLVDITERKKAEQAAQQSHAELRLHASELERFNRVAVERELRIIEMKKEINALCARLGEPSRYPLTFELNGNEAHPEELATTRVPGNGARENQSMSDQEAS